MILGILASGDLGHNTIREIRRSGIFISFVFCDRASQSIIDLANAEAMPFFIGNPRDGRGAAWLNQQAIAPELIVSINYLFLLDVDIIKLPVYGCINIHGSLLPKYRGRAPHIWAIINNEEHTGITAHYVDDGCDTGPIIHQEVVAINKETTGGELLAHYRSAYPRIVIDVINRCAEHGLLSSTAQNEDNATYFGVRRPDDGRIIWSWQKERIYNWVRALTFPYPGAFAYYQNEKVIFDRSEYSEVGFRYDAPNGLVLRGGGRPVVKTPNGAIVLHPREGHIVFNGNEILL